MSYRQNLTRKLLILRSTNSIPDRLLELFRRGKLSHYELSRILGLDRFETDAYLKHHNVFEGSLTWEEIEADRDTLRDLFSQER